MRCSRGSRRRSARVRAPCSGSCSARRPAARSASRAGPGVVARRDWSRSSPGAITWWRATPRRCAALAASPGDDDLLTHTRWCELLGREALSRRFYRTLEQCVGGLAESLPRAAARRSRASWRCWPRRGCSFSRSSRRRAGSTATAHFSRDSSTRAWRAAAASTSACCCRSGSGRSTRRSAVARARRARSAPIPFLNGGLFGKTALERRHSGARFSDEALGRFFGDVLGAFRFTAREEHERWSEAAIDPEMLGRAFESLMASRERRTSGAFYTPQVLVAHVAEAALSSASRAKAE